MAGYAGPKTWLLDHGFDNDEVWWWIWQQPNSHLVCRIYHFERVVEWQTPAGQWEERHLDATFAHLKPLARVAAQLEVRLKGQKRAKKQRVTAQNSAVPIRVYAPDDKTQTQPVWVVKVKIEHAHGEPWHLLVG